MRGEVLKRGPGGVWVGARAGLVLLAAAALIVPARSDAAFPAAASGKIAYARYDGAQSDLFLMGSDGSNQTPLTATAAPASETDPAFFPDGRRLAHSRCDGTQCDVFVMNIDGSEAVDLTNTPAPLSEVQAAVSPDGSQIAFAQFDGSQYDLLLMKSDGSGVRKLTNTAAPVRENEPSFFPDGKRITFQRSSGGESDLLAINADGTGEMPLTNTLAPNGEAQPDPSPDGGRIGFAGPQEDLWVLNLDGSGMLDLTPGTMDEEFSPDFSPDGMRIAAARLGATGQDLFAVAATGGATTPLTATPSPLDENDPDWETIYRCGGRRATIVGDDGPDRIKGTKRKDVVAANATSAGKNVVKGKGGNDTICVGKGKAKVNCGAGKRDKVIATGKGKKTAKGCERMKGKAFGKR